jgi:hypothetical protein
MNTKNSLIVSLQVNVLIPKNPAGAIRLLPAE